MSPESTPPDDNNNAPPGDDIGGGEALSPGDEQQPGQQQEDNLPPGIINPQATPADSMEVHHHPDIHHKPKPWKEYIVEYIMIVLAVTTGFFAESLREHIGEQEKETEIIHSLANDLKNDTAIITGVIEGSKYLAMSLDTMATLLRNYKPADSTNYKLYELYIKSGLQDEYTPVERTLKQLRNNGEWRLIKKKEVASELLDYETATNGLENYNKIYENYTDRSVVMAAEVFNMSYFTYYTGTDAFVPSATITGDTSMVISPQYRHTPLKLLNSSAGLLGKYANLVWYQMVVERSYRQQLIDFKAEEAKLLGVLEKYYPGSVKEEE